MRICSREPFFLINKTFRQFAGNVLMVPGHWIWLYPLGLICNEVAVANVSWFVNMDIEFTEKYLEKKVVIDIETEKLNYQ